MPQTKRLYQKNKSIAQRQSKHPQTQVHQNELATLQRIANDNRAISSLSHHDITTLQRTIGNHKTLQLLRQQETGHIQRDDVITMDPMTVTGDKGTGTTVEQNVSGLDNLKGKGADPDEDMSAEMTTDAEGIVNPKEALPYTKAGWDSDKILSSLGQLDNIAGTDSDSRRCVQAVAMASYIPSGPDAVASYLTSSKLQGMLAGEPSPRQQAAMKIIELVKERILAKTATYGDLSWAQEAIHDMFYNDVSGTPADEVMSQVNPAFSALNRNTNDLDIWCSKPEEVMAHAKALPSGGQLVIATQLVTFNDSFAQLEVENMTGAAKHSIQNRMLVNNEGRDVWITRIPASTRPDPKKIDKNRDGISGHQLLIIKDNTPEGALKIYDPVAAAGNLLKTISESGAELQNDFQELPDAQTYGYVQILGKIEPQETPPSAWGR